MTADGAYDGEPVYQAVARHQSDPVPDIVIPPRASAVPSAQSAEAQSQRDHHIRIIAEKGRMGWQKATGYGRRNLAETAVGRYKAIIGPKLRARILPAQQGETAIAAEVLNHMIADCEAGFHSRRLTPWTRRDQYCGPIHIPAPTP